MTKLNQIIAVEKGLRTRVFEQVTQAYHRLQKGALLSGIARSYQPADDDGDQLPPESTRVQVRATEVLQDVAAAFGELIDAVATKDRANLRAGADVIVDGQTILGDVPVTTLLFLEKQLTDLHTFIKKLPVLDAAEHWDYDGTTDCWATQPTQTTKTKKVPRNHVKAEATKEHPAQVDVYHEDVIVGRWQTVKFSGAMPAQRVRELTERVEALQDAVKQAREEANALDVERESVGVDVMEYLLQ